MKKIAIVTLIVIIAIFAFCYVQTQKLENMVSAKLAQYETVFQQFNLGFFPQPYLSFENIRHNQITIEKLTGKFPLSALFSGEMQLQQLNFQHVKFSDNAQNSADIQMSFSDFSLDNISAEGVAFNGENSIIVELEKTLYGNNKIFHFNFVKGAISSLGERKFAVLLDHAILNKQPLGYINAEMDLSQYTKYLMADIDSYCSSPLPCTAHLDYVSEPEKSAVDFSAKNYPIERLLAWLMFPNTLTGNADVDIAMQFAHSQIVDGKFSFDAKNGELLGLSLLELAGQYLPINWNDAELKGKKDINTKYEHFVSNAVLNRHQLDIDKISLKTTALLGEGSGRVDLQSMQCDIQLNLSATNEKYDDISLPIHFFDSCYSPQYEVKIDRDFRNKIKDLIKRKFKQ